MKLKALDFQVHLSAYLWVIVLPHVLRIWIWQSDDILCLKTIYNFVRQDPKKCKFSMTYFNIIRSQIIFMR